MSSFHTILCAIAALHQSIKNILRDIYKITFGLGKLKSPELGPVKVPLATSKPAPITVEENGRRKNRGVNI